MPSKQGITRRATPPTSTVTLCVTHVFCCTKRMARFILRTGEPRGCQLRTIGGADEHRFGWFGKSLAI